VNGTVRIVASPITCAATEPILTWNQIGPQEHPARLVRSASQVFLVLNGAGGAQSGRKAFKAQPAGWSGLDRRRQGRSGRSGSRWTSGGKGDQA